MQAALILELEKREIAVEAFEGTLNISLGKGLRKTRANIDPYAVTEMDLRELSFYVEGLYRVLSQPVKSIVKKWTFRQSAATLLPMVQTISYVKGVEDAGNSPALSWPLIDDLVLCFGVQWDRGTHIITKEQLERWEVSLERVYSAAKSMLYHRSEYVEAKEIEGEIFSFTAGDGADAARFLILEDKLFGDIQSDFIFSIPSPDIFLFHPDNSKSAYFSKVVQKRYDERATLLSSSIYSFDSKTKTLHIET